MTADEKNHHRLKVKEVRNPEQDVEELFVWIPLKHRKQRKKHLGRGEAKIRKLAKVYFYVMIGRCRADLSSPYVDPIVKGYFKLN